MFAKSPSLVRLRMGSPPTESNYSQNYYHYHRNKVHSTVDAVIEENRKELLSSVNFPFTNKSFIMAIEMMVTKSTLRSYAIDIPLLTAFTRLKFIGLNKYNQKKIEELQREAVLLLNQIDDSPRYKFIFLVKCIGEEQNDGLSKLPVELQVMIANYLPWSSFQRLMLISRYWNHLAYSIAVKFNFIRVGDSYALRITKFPAKPSYMELRQIVIAAKNASRHKVLFNFFKKESTRIKYDGLLAACNEYGQLKLRSS